MNAIVWFALLAGMLAVRGAFAAPLPVGTGTVVMRSYQPRITVLARGRSMDRVVMDAPFAGVMAPLPLPPGGTAARGTVIARVLPLRLAGQARAAAADVRSASRAFDQEQVLARTGIATAAGLEAARARLVHARAVLQGIDARLGRGVVRAPFAGTVTYAVAAGAWVVPGRAVVRVAGSGDFYLTADVPASMAVLLKPGDTAAVAARGGHWRGHLYAIGARAGRGGLVTVYVRCRCRLLAGEFARLTVRGAGVPGLAVARRAVVMNAGQAVVYRVDGSLAKAVPVSIVHAGRHWTWISGPLSAGSVVITAGAATMRSGTAVHVVHGIRSAR